MADKGYTDALWVGTPSELADKTPLIPGVTVVAIPAGEAEASDNWQPVEKGRPKPKADAEGDD